MFGDIHTENKSLNRYKRPLINILGVLSIGILILGSCANPVSPSGGPKDTDPPDVVDTDPGNYSTGFEDDEVELEFNEFVKLENPNEQIVISPPLQELPEYKLRGKTLEIEFQEELWANATYTVFFGTSIKDITEGNPLGNYQYVFSTGASLDSMEMFGQVRDAFTLAPRENVVVMLYRSLYDSVPMLERPYYVSKTDAEGYFRLSNLADTVYRIFALKDANNNYIYDLPNEELAFIDSLVSPQKPFEMEIDTAAADTLPVDSLRRAALRNNARFKTLRMFDEIDSTQKLLKAVAEKPYKLKIIYRFPTIDHDIDILEPSGLSDWKIEEWNPLHDTLICWLQNVNTDSLSLVISDTATVLDTVELALSKPAGEDEEELKKEKLEFKANIARGRLGLSKDVHFTASEPIMEFDFSRILFAEGSDTLEEDLNASFTDSLKRRFKIEHNWKIDSTYRILIPDSVFISMYGHSHDTLSYRFNLPSPDDFGELSLTLQSSDTTANYIVQLVKPGKEKESIIREQQGSKNLRFTFQYLKPDSYLVKVIIDKNSNGRWDAGNYLKGIQPEEVQYLNTEIEVRAQWAIEETMVIEQKDAGIKKPE